jgi:ABC-type transport system involved in multi-copper enzyme maturation permease subunit
LTDSRFLISLEWELRNLFRFPFPEILLALFTFMVFLPQTSTYTATFHLNAESWQHIAREITWQSTYIAAFFSVNAYLPLAILGAIFGTMAFAYEIENGLLKVHLSQPTSKKVVFLSKWISCFLVIFATLSCVLLFFTFLYIPQNDPYLLINSDLTLKILLLAALETFFIVGVTVSFSIISKKASVSLVGSFATLYVLQLVSQTAGLSYLPPGSFYSQVELLFGETGSNLAFLLDSLPSLIVAAFLTVVSVIYFSRRLELS